MDSFIAFRKYLHDQHEFTKLIVSLFYPFTVDELLRYKSKLILGSISVFNYQMSESEAQEFQDDDEISIKYGLLFNSYVNWNDNTVLNIFNLTSNKYSIKYSDHAFTLPLNKDHIKTFETQQNEEDFLAQWQELYNVEYDLLVEACEKLGIINYTCDLSGKIEGPQILVDYLKDQIEPMRQELRDCQNYNKSLLDTRYSEVITSQLNLDELSEYVDKDGLFYLCNPKLWSLTISPFIDRSTLDHIFIQK